jgi:hypothetical protein
MSLLVFLRQLPFMLEFIDAFSILGRSGGVEL